MLDRTRRLKKEVERLQGILDDFLSYVRGPRPSLQRLSLNQVVREFTDLVAPGLEKQKLTVSMHLQEGLPEVLADGSLLHQALLNLVKNAEQALLGAERHGEILLSTGLEERDGRRYVQVSVIDSGPGIDAETLPELFRPYFSTKPGGTGLGLPIAQRFVEDQGGELGVESQLGIGTRFTLRLPIADERCEIEAEEAKSGDSFDFGGGELEGQSEEGEA
ncbi:MAG: two-component sensor histidine kinase [Planctomycetota bacterium]|nr:MAG: two-component sensor histidine kinase [Planctomycetota bacterium]